MADSGQDPPRLNMSSKTPKENGIQLTHFSMCEEKSNINQEAEFAHKCNSQTSIFIWTVLFLCAGEGKADELR